MGQWLSLLLFAGVAQVAVGGRGLHLQRDRLSTAYRARMKVAGVGFATWLMKKDVCFKDVIGSEKLVNY